MAKNYARAKYIITRLKKFAKKKSSWVRKFCLNFPEQMRLDLKNHFISTMCASQINNSINSFIYRCVIQKKKEIFFANNPKIKTNVFKVPSFQKALQFYKNKQKLIFICFVQLILVQCLFTSGHIRIITKHFLNLYF